MGKRHGIGKNVNNKGDYYDGEWSEDKINGEGKM